MARSGPVDRKRFDAGVLAQVPRVPAAILSEPGCELQLLLVIEVLLIHICGCDQRFHPRSTAGTLDDRKGHRARHDTIWRLWSSPRLRCEPAGREDALADSLRNSTGETLVEPVLFFVQVARSARLHLLEQPFDAEELRLEQHTRTQLQVILRQYDDACAHARQQHTEGIGITIEELRLIAIVAPRIGVEP
eukprot:scaffold55494_cov75-Phaeocystis_antarctica.AAC.4